MGLSKPRIFIGSSTESKSVAEHLQEALEFDADGVVWDQGVFELMEHTVESFEAVLDSFDFAAFVFAPDDKTELRKTTVPTVRDNVVFELGLFMGRLGRERTVIVQPRDGTLHLPSDLLGLTTAKYDGSRGDLAAAMGPVATKIKRVLQKRGRRRRDLVVQVAAKTEGVDDEAVTPGPAPDALIPQENWSREDYDLAMFYLVKNNSSLSELRSTFLASPLGSSPDAAPVWDAKHEQFLVLLNLGGSVERLKALVENNPSIPRLRRILGNVLAHLKDHAGAAAQYRVAAETGDRAAAIADCVLHLITQSDEAGIKVDVSELMNLLGRVPPTADDELQLLEALQKVAELSDLQELAFAIAERRILLSPLDFTLRFDVAYDYADKGYDDLALAHYGSIPEQQRGAGAWNNIGVARSSLKMPGKAVEAFAASSEMENTLADANLADRLREAGFFDKAEEVLEAAIRRPDYSPNVVSSLDALRAARTEEDESERASKGSARKKQGLLAPIGLAAASTTIHPLSGWWDMGSFLVELREVAPGEFTGSGEYVEQPAIGLGGLAAALGGRPAAPRTMVLGVSLKRIGNAVQGAVTRSAEGETVSLLGSLFAERRVVGAVDETGDALTIWEPNAAEEPETWRRCRNPA